jgi:hypothetical protein
MFANADNRWRPSSLPLLIKSLSFPFLLVSHEYPECPGHRVSSMCNDRHILGSAVVAFCTAFLPAICVAVFCTFCRADCAPIGRPDCASIGCPNC